MAPVNIEQGTANFSYVVSRCQPLNFYYAIQRDERNEPPSTDGNSFPGHGRQRNGHRQLLTINEVWTISPSLVNEFRAGPTGFTSCSRRTKPTRRGYGINSGVTAAIGLPQITVTGAFEFGGISGFPQGRGDNVITISDTLTWIHGHHTVKFGGEVPPAEFGQLLLHSGHVRLRQHHCVPGRSGQTLHGQHVQQLQSHVRELIGRVRHRCLEGHPDLYRHPGSSL